MADKDDGPGHAEVRVSSFAFARVRAVACARRWVARPATTRAEPPQRGTKAALRGCARVRACVVTDDVCVRVVCA
jgi:hypothetical protein